MIPYGKQSITQADVDAVLQVLRSDFLTQGPQVPLFEGAIAEYCNVKHAVAMNSATSALHVACLALGVGPGDTVWTSPNTFVASSNCALYCGAQVDFVDIDSQTYNLCSDKLAQKLATAEKQGKLPKVVIPVHFAGQSCDMRAIHNLSKKYGFSIIEDASHAIGSRYLNKPVGNCKFSDITVFSFHPVKIITTAEGGLATTNSLELAEKMQLFRSHGVTRSSELMNKIPEGGWYYQQVDLGFNYRMTEMQAALGVAQLARLDKMVERRHELQKRYVELLSKLPLILPYQCPDSFSALHLYPVQLDLERVSASRATIFEELRARGIGVNVHYIPVHTQPYYQQMGFKEGDYPEAELYYTRCISIPVFYGMTDLEQDRVVEVLTEVLR